MTLRSVVIDLDIYLPGEICLTSIYSPDDKGRNVCLLCMYVPIPLTAAYGAERVALDAEAVVVLPRAPRHMPSWKHEHL